MMSLCGLEQYYLDMQEQIVSRHKHVLSCNAKVLSDLFVVSCKSNRYEVQ